MLKRVMARNIRSLEMKENGKKYGEKEENEKKKMKRGRVKRRRRSKSKNTIWER